MSHLGLQQTLFAITKSVEMFSKLFKTKIDWMSNENEDNMGRIMFRKDLIFTVFVSFSNTSEMLNSSCPKLRLFFIHVTNVA